MPQSVGWYSTRLYPSLTRDAVKAAYAAETDYTSVVGKPRMDVFTHRFFPQNEVSLPAFVSSVFKTEVIRVTEMDLSSSR